MLVPPGPEAREVTFPKCPIYEAENWARLICLCGVDRQRLITKGKCRHRSCSFANGNQMRTELKCISVFPSKGTGFSKRADLGRLACRPFRARGFARHAVLLAWEADLLRSETWGCVRSPANYAQILPRVEICLEILLSQPLAPRNLTTTSAYVFGDRLGSFPWASQIGDVLCGQV